MMLVSDYGCWSFLSSWLMRRPPSWPWGVRMFLVSHLSVCVEGASFGVSVFRDPFFDLSKYDSWRDAWDLLDYLLPEEAVPYLARHPKAVLVAFEYEPVDKFRYF